MHHQAVGTLRPQNCTPYAPCARRGATWCARVQHLVLDKVRSSCRRRFVTVYSRGQCTALDSDDHDEWDHIKTTTTNTGRATARSVQEQQEDDPAAGKPGGGVVGLFVAGWMALLALIMQLLSPVFSLSLFVAQPLTNTNPVRARAVVDKWVTQLPQGFWARLHYVWERPLVKSIRITASIANWSVRLPAIAALLLAQGGALASTISFPMLAPLLLGTGMMVRSIQANASFIIPRLGLMVVLLWVLWFVTHVIQTTWMVLRNQGRIDMRTLATARMITECTSLLLAGIVVLSMLGINISALLLPAGVVLAIASRDLLQNFIAGFFLVLAQPFRLGDKVAISCTVPVGSSTYTSAAAATVSTPSGTATAAAATAANGYSSQHSPQGSSRGAAGGSSSGSSALPDSWFEGVCEKVDLRYTVLRDGRRRLMVPNTAFVSREFMVYDEGPEALRPHGMGSSSNWWWHQKSSSSAQDHQASSAAAAGGVGGVGAAGQSSSTDRSSRGQQQAAERQRSSSPEPSIVEGHMTTQLPPLAQPVYPGMHFVAPHHPAYPPFPAMHYQQPPLHPYHYQDPYYLQQQQQQEAGAANVDSWHQHQQDQQQQQGSDQQQQQEGQQEPSSQPQSRPVAKGPPGYLPQGFAAGPPYLGIPVGTLYYGVPGVVPWGTGGTAGVTAQPPQHTAPAAGPSANAGSGLADGRQQQQQPGQPWQQQQQPAQPWQQHGKASAQGASSAPSTDDDSGSSRCGGPGGSGGNAGGSSSSSIKGSQEATGQRRAGVPAPPAKQQSTGGGSSSTAGSAGSAAAASQQQQQQSAPLPVSPSGPGVQVPSHSMHVAAGLGFGMWGLAPGTPLQSPGSPHYLADLGMQGVSMGASPVGVWQPVSSGYSSLHHPAEPQLSQQEQQQQQQLPPHEAASAAAGAGVQGDAGVAAAAAAAAPADTEASQSTNLVFAVLQEITRQQL